MTSTAINVCASGIGNIAPAGKALEKIEALAASMGGELYCKKDTKIEVYGHAVYITTTIKLPVSALTEYIAQPEQAAGIFKLPKAGDTGMAEKTGDNAPELKIAEALEAIGLYAREIHAVRYGHSGFRLPIYTITAEDMKKEAT